MTDAIVVQDLYFRIFDEFDTDTTKAGNPNHDPLTGEFTTGSGNRTTDRENKRNKQERQEFKNQKQEFAQQKNQINRPEIAARERNQTLSGHFDTADPAAMENVAKETGGSRVFNFSTGEGSDLDRNVKLVTNTNKSGAFEKGALRVEIVDEKTQERQIYQRTMGEFSKLVNQLNAKKYNNISQHQRNSLYTMKADDTLKADLIAIENDWGKVLAFDDEELDALSYITEQEKIDLMQQNGVTLRLFMNAQSDIE